MIRRAKKEDLEDILYLYREFFPNENYSSSQEYISVWNEIISDSRMECFIGYSETNPVTTCLISVIPNLTRNRRPYGLIENVFTLPDYRRKGFGKAVMDAAVEFAKQQNCYKVIFLSSSERKDAHRFYKRIGFDGHSKKGFQLRIP